MSALLAGELDAFACPLTGVNQIEASAGTGKTWNICALYVRLLLERDLGADQILVVTFTNAATAELHERIRSRLVQVERALEHGASDGDPFVTRLFETTLAFPLGERAEEDGGIDPELARKRVRRALGQFDQAAIHTIHAFCQRALQEAPFAATLPFAFELEVDDGALRFDLAAQFWRERVDPVAAAHPAFAAWLVAREASPAALDAQLARRLRKPLAVLDWSAPQIDEDAPAAARAALETACAEWRAHEAAIAALLEQAQPALKLTSHKPETVRAALQTWGAYCARGRFDTPPPAPVYKLAQSALEKATKKGGETPRHAFFAQLDALDAALAAAEASLEARWLQLLRAWLETAPAALTERKRAQRVAAFDDLLGNLYRALRTHPWLAETLRTRYPAALIDEFQDTDPLQFAVFEAIFAPAGPLFLVGDPKQAIYSFRSADLHTYLAVREQAGARYTLAVNQRSTAPLVAACNRLFASNPAAFVLEGLSYTPVRAADRERARFVDAEGPRGGQGLHVWRLPGGDRMFGKRAAQRHAAQACAAEVARLLRGARDGTVRLGDRPLAPGEIAVLVQTHRQGSLIKRALAAWGIGSVELAQASVFAGIDAEQLERVLAAIDAPGDLRRLRAALAADWFGLDAAGLWRLAEDEVSSADSGTDLDAASASTWVERFARYRQLWHERGFAVMWRALERELGIAERLMGGADGERRVTNLHHLAELAQARASAQPGIAPTLRWLAAQRLDGGGDDAQLRLESDRDLVQIVTVHRSKGLEYAVVFCPFLNDGALREAPSSDLPDACEYRDANGDVVLHYGCPPELAERAAREATREQAAERVRLIYVALTRAVHRCYLVAGPYAIGRSSKEARRSVLNWIVAGQGHEFSAWRADPPEEPELEQAWQALAGPEISLEPVPEPGQPEPLAARRAPGALRDALRLRRGRLAAWRIASFTSLASARVREEAGMPPADENLRPDHDAWALPAAVPAARPVEPAGDALAVGAQVQDEAALLASASERTAPPSATEGAATLDLFASSVEPDVGVAGDRVPGGAVPGGPVPGGPVPGSPIPGGPDITAFPRGAAAGECLHRLLELADFSDPGTWPEAIRRALEERPVIAGPDLAEQLPAMMAQLLADLTATELERGLRLDALDPARRLTEMEFLFPVDELDFDALRALLDGHGYRDLALEAGRLNGYVKGFIDLIVEHDGRFRIIDWKSNHLGATPEAYGPAALETAMAEHAYELQALLYTLALHRFLRMRVADYDYDKHMGGYLYLFVRGVRPQWHAGGHPAGVYARRAPRALIEALDALMRGERR